MGTRLFVGNLSFDTTEGDVLDLFKQAGTVVRCDLIVDKFTTSRAASPSSKWNPRGSQCRHREVSRPGLPRA